MRGKGRTVAVMVALLMVGAVVPAIYFAVTPAAPSVPAMRAAQGVHAVPYHQPTLPADAAAHAYRAGAAVWPAARSGVIALSPHTIRPVHLTGSPIWAQGSASVTVRVVDHRAAVDAGVDGVVFAVTPHGSGTTVGVDYGSFAHAYGGNYGPRLHMVSLPACALTTPTMPACRTRTPLPGHNDPATQSVSAQLASSTAPMVLAATSTATDGDGGGTAGQYSATTLKPSGSWTAGGSSGSFTYDYPINVPPAASGLVPKLALSYDSGGVDGQTAATEAQASWVGDGWSTPQSFVEQEFTSCSDDPEGSAAPKSTSDECYDGQILTLSLDGTSTSLVWDAAKKVFRTANDNGDAITRVTGSGNGSGAYDTAYWKITDRTGTSYYFGRNHLPGWTSGDTATDSVDTEPVFAAHSGDPCYDATWTNSVCTMAYRWNLDYVTDVHGDAMAYYYTQDSNAYGENGNTTSATSYVRDSHLARIDYGFTDGSAYTVDSGHAPDQVVLTTADRCVSGTCDPLNSTNAPNWPDVPYDLHCTTGAACQVSSPSFWSTVRLTEIRTQQWTGSAYAPVDSWSLHQTMPATGDGTSPTLWLASITHTGSDTTAGGPAVTLPSVTFTAIDLQNRVATHDGLPILTRNRISSITTETGAVIGVSYEQVNACTAPVSITPSANTSSCYPIYWTPFGYTKQIQDWYVKYEVAQVTVADPTGGSPTMSTEYTYPGGGAWHYDDNEVVRAKYRTYGQWRGFGDVRTFTGQGNDTQTEAETTYYRGMSDDNDTTAVTLADSQGGKHDDTNQLAGETLETTTYNFAGGPIMGSTIDSYWVSPATATRTRTGLPALTANATGQVEQWTRTAITDTPTTTWRTTETDTSYDTDAASPTFGLPLVTFAHGDLATTTQQRCTTTTYAPANSAENLAGLVSEVEVDADPCGGTNPAGASAPTSAQVNGLTAPTSIQRPADVVSDTRTVYDNPTLAQTWPQPATLPAPAVPTKGDVSEMLRANGFSGGTFTYQIEKANTYDTEGRPLAAYDPLGNRTTTAYTMANGLTVGTTTTNPLGQITTATLDPLRGVPTASTDANSITSTTHYDGLGRATAVWGYGRATTAPANALFTYQVSPTAPTAITTQAMNNGLGYHTSTTLYDAMLRVRQTQNPTPQGGRLVSDTFYDSRGWAVKKNTNWWDSKSTPDTTLVAVSDSQVDRQDVFAFNGNGQPVLDTSYDQSAVHSRTATAYTGDKTITVPLNANGQPFAGGTATATVTDALGRTIEKDDYTTPPAVSISTGSTTVTVTGGVSQATQYVFDTVGHQTDVRDATSGEDWHSGYDLLGRVITKTDPDAGTSTMSYDAAGDLTQATDSRNKTISYTYDQLHRKTGEYDAPTAAQSPASQMAAWVYDNADNAVPAMTDAVGHVTTTTRYAGGNAYVDQQSGFNAYGESLGETITLPSVEGALAGSYTFTHTYTSGTALPDRDTYPAAGSLPGETVTHGYETALDLPIGPGGLAAYTDNADYAPDQQVAEVELGLNQGNHASVTNTFDPNTRMLTDSQVTNTAVSVTPIDDTSYTYDPAGNPTSQSDKRLASGGVATETQCFTYDNLDRLTQAWTAAGGCDTDPTTNSVGDGIPGGAYWTTWRLDPLAQRTQETDHGVGGAQDTITDYTYGTTAPNTLVSTTTTGPSGTTSTSYGYDSTANTTSRNTPANGEETLTWSDDDLLTTVNSSQYVYDAAGKLLIQKDPGGTTLYLPQEQLHLDTNTGVITGLRFYALPGGATAIRSGSGANYDYEIADPHGTGLLVLDSTLTTPTWRQYTPYGAPRGTTPAAWPDNRGFLNDPNDGATGLTDIGARWYDPSTGRFVSLDPVFEATSSQEQNGYTYSADNPTGTSDPTGLTHCDVGICPTPWQSAHAPGLGPANPRDPTNVNPYSGSPASPYAYNQAKYDAVQHYFDTHPSVYNWAISQYVQTLRAWNAALAEAFRPKPHRGFFSSIGHYISQHWVGLTEVALGALSFSPVGWLAAAAFVAGMGLGAYTSTQSCIQGQGGNCIVGWTSEVSAAAGYFGGEMGDSMLEESRTYIGFREFPMKAGTYLAGKAFKFVGHLENASSLAFSVMGLFDLQCHSNCDRGDT